MKVTFLSADVPLSKSFSLGPDGQLQKSSYPSVKEFTSHSEDVSNLKDFAVRLQHHANLGHCLLKGNTGRSLVVESRAGSTDANEVTWYMVYDLDRSLFKTPIEFLASIGQAKLDHVVQYSASYGIEKDRGLTCHIMIKLAKPALPAQLKHYLMHLNLSVPSLAAGLALTKTNTALSWPLDTTTCQNDKLIYIAPPALGTGVEVPAVQRIEFFEGTERALELPESMPSAALLRTDTDAKVNALRKAKGLTERKFKYSEEGILKDCDAATMSGIKKERGFTYFNLNGGDSWGYYHPDDDPGTIRNFKGEPDYKTSELLPEYWTKLRQERKANVEKPAGQTQVLVFRDFETGLYYNGTWADPKLDIAQAKSETQIQHYLKAKGLPEVDFVPVWRVEFDPHSDMRVDFAGQRVNLWAPTPYMKDPQLGLWPTIDRLIQHAVAYDPAVREHFLNWLACVWQFRDRNLIAWVLHGTQGTGKGMLVHHVLAPLFGREVVVVKRMEELEEPYNDYIERALLVVIDEAQISDSKRSRMIMSNIKNMITEPEVSVRRMYASARRTRNYSNWLFLSNMPDPVMIDAGDRRFNVGEFRHERLVLDDKFIECIGKELMGFAFYLTNREASYEKARAILQSDERTRIIDTSRTSAETVADALLKGQLELFWDAMPTVDAEYLPPEQASLVTEYRRLIHESVVGNKTKFTRDELRVLFEFTCGEMPRTPTKFTQFLRHRSIHLKVIRIGDHTVRGVEVAWDVDDIWRAQRKAEITSPNKLRVA